MKKSYFLVSALLLTAAASYGQGTELFLSEYDEGAHQSGVSYNGGVSNSTGSERAIEIFNPTVASVNLNAYSVRRYSNGSAAVTEEEKLQRRTGTNVLNPSAAFVFASGEATITAITSKADQLSAGHAPVTGPNVIFGGGMAYFNGDDAIALVRWTSGTAGVGTPVLIDIFGSIGFQPLPASGTGTGQWSGTNPADGTPAVYVASANQSLMRRDNISRGIRTNNPTNWNPATEWTVYSYAFPPGSTGNTEVGNQSYARLGEHNDYSGPNGLYLPLKTLEKFNSGISIYPNPASGSATVEIKDVKVGNIIVLNSLGQSITAQPRGMNEKITLDISALKPGLYFVQCLSADGQIKIYKELVVK
ncbi:T9SS type A sorting domain-containing protein [Hymenobacter persicinus]|uniref:T9SS type A sorting domain-containing protein n=1 Tax=Hymenobacter persicinus TaxID=2025506 RepID=A0A4Q5LA17_9BACT|nr:T9SS type A sorting domain-containing protein [Hymenobacter persicinus]RYU77701.1 T9SS type A sorting domain-containing protein [Hymenobacter persicinus]